MTTAISSLSNIDNNDLSTSNDVNDHNKLSPIAALKNNESQLNAIKNYFDETQIHVVVEEAINVLAHQQPKDSLLALHQFISSKMKPAQIETVYLKFYNACHVNDHYNGIQVQIHLRIFDVVKNVTSVFLHPVHEAEILTKPLPNEWIDTSGTITDKDKNNNDGLMSVTIQQILTTTGKKIAESLANMNIADYTSIMNIIVAHQLAAFQQHQNKHLLQDHQTALQDQKQENTSTPPELEPPHNIQIARSNFINDSLKAFFWSLNYAILKACSYERNLPVWKYIRQHYNKLSQDSDNIFKMHYPQIVVPVIGSQQQVSVILNKNKSSYVEMLTLIKNIKKTLQTKMNQTSISSQPSSVNPVVTPPTTTGKANYASPISKLNNNTNNGPSSSMLSPTSPVNVATTVTSNSSSIANTSIKYLSMEEMVKEVEEAIAANGYKINDEDMSLSLNFNSNSIFDAENRVYDLTSLLSSLNPAIPSSSILSANNGKLSSQQYVDYIISVLGQGINGKGPIRMVEHVIASQDLEGRQLLKEKLGNKIVVIPSLSNSSLVSSAGSTSVLNTNKNVPSSNNFSFSYNKYNNMDELVQHIYTTLDKPARSHSPLVNATNSTPTSWKQSNNSNSISNHTSTARLMIHQVDLPETSSLQLSQELQLFVDLAVGCKVFYVKLKGLFQPEHISVFNLLDNIVPSDHS